MPKQCLRTIYPKGVSHCILLAVSYVNGVRRPWVFADVAKMRTRWHDDACTLAAYIVEWHGVEWQATRWGPGSSSYTRRLLLWVPFRASACGRQARANVLGQQVYTHTTTKRAGLGCCMDGAMYTYPPTRRAHTCRYAESTRRANKARARVSREGVIRYPQCVCVASRVSLRAMSICSPGHASSSPGICNALLHQQQQHHCRHVFT